MSARTTPGGPTPRRPRRRIVWVALAALLVAAAAGGWLVLRPGTDDAPVPEAATATPTATDLPPAGSYGDSALDPAISVAPTDVPGAVLAGAPGLPEAMTPVALGQPATSGDGVTARLLDIKAITAAAHLPGETAGPALAVIVELTNGSGKAVSLDTVAVNLYLGEEGIRAARVQADSGQPFSGTLDAGASAQAVYAFVVPEDERELVTVTVGHAADTGSAVFAGAVA
jgi:hypothetical protein